MEFKWHTFARRLLLWELAFFLVWLLSFFTFTILFQARSPAAARPAACEPCSLRVALARGGGVLLL